MTLAEWTKEDIRIRHQLHSAKMLLSTAKLPHLKAEHIRVVFVYEMHVIPAHLKRKPLK